MGKSEFNKKLLSFFGIKTKKSRQQEIPVPAMRTDNGSYVVRKMPTDIQKYYDYWISNYDNFSTLKDRFNRYKDLEFCILNSGMLGFAHELYTDETINADENDRIIIAKASSKRFEKYIYNFFNNLGIDRQLLRSTSDDLSLYADHFWILGLDETKGVTSVTPLDVYSIKKRIEFNGVNVAKQLSGGAVNTYINKNHQLKKLVKVLKDTDITKDHGSAFQTFLFGFELEDGIILPPWNVAHFRRYDPKSEFAPYGNPLFFKSIARFRQMKALENILAMARVAKFPKEVYSVTVDENMTESEKWNAINKAREEYSNINNYDVDNEDLGIGSPIWTADGLIDYKVLDSRMTLDDIGDYEAIREDLALSTSVPQGYYNPNKSSFGNSGQSLLQQYKPFGRKVYHNQSAILDELVHIVQLHLAITGDFDVDEPFELRMNFPVIEEAQDRLRMKNDTLRLAKDVIDNIGQAVGLDRGEALPIEIVRDVFAKYSFIDPDDLDAWIDALPTKEEEHFESITDDNKKKIIEKNINKLRSLKEDVIREAYFKAKFDNNFDEGISNGVHYLTSHKRSPMQKKTIEMVSPSKTSSLLKETEVEGGNFD